MKLKELLNWEVIEKPIMLTNGKLITNGKALVRSDNDKVLEVVNSNFVPFENKELFHLINQIAEKENINESDIRIVENDIGNKISVILNLDFNYSVRDDVVSNQLLVQNSHGGFASLSFGFGNLVMSCSNGMVIFNKNLGYKIYHNKYLKSKSNLISNNIESIKRNIISFKEFSNKIADKTIKNREGIILDAINYATNVDLSITIEQYINKYRNFKDEDILYYKWDQSNILREALHYEMNNKGDNYWGLLNGFTYYTNHKAKPINPSVFLTYGYGKVVNDLALKYIQQKLNLNYLN